MRHSICFQTLIVMICMPIFAIAQTPDPRTTDRALSEAYFLPELFEIMAEEGVASLALPGSTPLDARTHQRWMSQVQTVYDPQKMHMSFMKALTDEMRPAKGLRDAALEFALSDVGSKVLNLEVSARRALLDDAVDHAARSVLDDARVAEMGTELARRLKDVRERVSVNDLIELNVSLGLNTSYAYFLGMQSADNMRGIGEDEILARVAEQEADIRAEVTDWIEAYFLLAYGPLTHDEMRLYVDFARSPDGIAFNRAMFRAFDAVYVPISRAVGRSLGQALQSEDL